jgi:hypothetical protein
MALNNLGVVRALQGNTQEWRIYFESASNPSKRLETTSSRNINALEQRMGFEVVVSS